MQARRSSVSAGPLLTAVVMALTLVTAGASAQAQEEPVGDVCALLTREEVGEALGTEVAVDGDADESVTSCTWAPTDPDSYASLDAEWSSGTADEIQSAYSSAVERTVAGYPAWYDAYVLSIALDAGVLTLHGVGDGDPIDVLTGLGELAVPRAAALPAPQADAPGSLGDAFCALFTPGEVRDILGTKVAAAPNPVGCTWSATKSGQSAAATAGWTDVTLADQKAAWPDGADVTVGGRTAYYSPGFFLNELLIEVDAGVLWIVVTGFDGDVEAALTALGELAVPRSGSLPPPPF